MLSAPYGHAPSDPSQPPDRRRDRGLSPNEQSVVALSLFDHVSTIREPGGLARLLGWAFGFRASNRLANERLEHLRRYSVLLRLGDPSIVQTRSQLRQQFRFSETALLEVEELIRRNRRA
ncbi:hypothetical protein GON01_02685 [Sphingomonas sp. MAH-20]|uniref:Uncharacterized protein n=1 Tax=Sphingomonas horti TaxID=2682842 RepID=A0A6I4IXM0_9SPHN|nr:MULTISPECIES: hypothetical protein [Sphingomonas]MBA2920859.1 hypothetical protein [Sphingomonas sp. CGMCC 1.13658]MVO76845.1 hypothetical protein [Sphingomonas horti]